MEYFRRPQIASKNAPRTTYAKVRGSVRRHDADGLHATPYFSGMSAGQKLYVNYSKAGVVTNFSVTLNFTDFATIISDLNTAMATKVVAIDDDGALSLQSLTAGGDTYVSVVDGLTSCALALGFDTRFGAVTSYGGDLATTPHGRIGIPNGVSVLNTGENVTAASVQRIVDRLAANADVTFADTMRPNAVMQPVSSITIAPDGTYVTPPPSTRIYTGGLSNASTKEDLAPYFFLLDTVTKQPTASRVVGVTKGTPGGARPYTNCPNWAGAGNVLGVSVVKQAASAITTITNGRLIEMATPAIADVVPGDLAEISGSTNLTPTNNGGTGPRWIIEAIDATRTLLTVRPLSKSELAQLGSTSLPSQPQSELNDFKEITETYGNVIIHTGYATTNVNLYVDPPLPTGASVQLWAVQPLSMREGKGWNEAAQNFPSAIAPQSNLDTAHNAILSAPSVLLNTPAAGDITVGSYYVRWHGRTCFVPQKVFLNAGIWIGYLYWDETTCATEKLVAPTGTSAFNGPNSPGPNLSATATVGTLGKPIAYVDSIVLGLNETFVCRIAEADASPQITVGHGGNFQSLQDAVEYLVVMQKASQEGTLQPEGGYAHPEIVLLSDCLVTNSILSQGLSLKIRGANPRVRLILGDSVGLFMGGGSLLLEDLTLKSISNLATGAVPVSSCAELTLRNVRQDMTSDAAGVGYAFNHLCLGIQKLTIADCDLYINKGIMGAAQSTPVISLYNSSFTWGALFLAATPQLISYGVSPAATNTPIASLTARDCSFNLFPLGTAYPLLLQDVSGGKVVLDSCYFSFASTQSDSTLIYSSNVSMSGCRIDGRSGAALLGRVTDYADSGNIEIDSCRIDLSPFGTGILARTLTNSILTFTGYNNASTGAKVSSRAEGNVITGSVSRGLSMGALPTTSGASASGNRVVLTTSGSTTVIDYCVEVRSDNASVTGNYLSNNYPGGYGIYCSVSHNGQSVIGNSIYTTGGGSNVYLLSPISCRIANNYLHNVAAAGPSGGSAVYLTSPTRAVVDGNTVYLSEPGGSSNPQYAGTGVTVLTGGDVTVTGNSVYAYNAISAPTAVSTTVSGNSFDVESGAALSGVFSSNLCTGAWTFGGGTSVSATDNTFSLSDTNDDFGPSGGVLIQPSVASSFLGFYDNVINVTGNSLIMSSVHATSKTEMCGNRMLGAATLVSGASIVFNDNLIEGALDLTGVVAGQVEIVGNIVYGASTVVPFASSAPVVTSNYFNAFSFTYSNGVRGTITGNRFGSGVTLTAPATDAKVSFTGNTVTGNTVLTSDPASAASLEFDGNRLQAVTLDAAIGIITLSDNVVEGAAVLTKVSASNNRFTGTVSLTGTTSSTSTIFLGNVCLDSVTATDCRVFSDNVCGGVTTVTGTAALSPCGFSGNYIGALASPNAISLSYCNGSGNSAQGNGVTLISCSLSDSLILSTKNTAPGMSLSGTCVLSGCQILNLAASAAGPTEISGSVKFSNCDISHTAAPISSTANKVMFDQCVIVSVISGIPATALGSIAYMSGCKVTGTVSLSGFGEAKVSSSSFSSNLTLNGDLVTVSEVQSGTTSVSGSSLLVNGSKTEGNLTLSNFTGIRLAGTQVSGNLVLSGAASEDNVVTIDGCYVSGNLTGSGSNSGLPCSSRISNSTFANIVAGTDRRVQLIGCTFANFTTYGGVSVLSSDTVLTGCSFSGTVTTAAVSIVHDLRMTGCVGGKVFLQGAPRWLNISDNVIRGGTAYGAPALDIEPTTAVPVGRWKISNNQIIVELTDTTPRSAVYLHSGTWGTFEDILISENSIEISQVGAAVPAMVLHAIYFGKPVHKLMLVGNRIRMPRPGDPDGVDAGSSVTNFNAGGVSNDVLFSSNFALYTELGISTVVGSDVKLQGNVVFGPIPDVTLVT